jgi:hypothetical protein
MTNATVDKDAEIVALRRKVMELASAVRMSETLDEAIEAANRAWPANMNDALRQGFDEVDLLWRRIDAAAGKPLADEESRALDEAIRCFWPGGWQSQALVALRSRMGGRTATGEGDACTAES